MVKVESVRKAGYQPYEEVNRGKLADRVAAARMGEHNREFLETVNKNHKVEILAGTGAGEK